MKDEEYNLWLCSIPGLGIRKLLLLEAEIGTPEQIYRAGEARLVKIKGISARDAHNIVTSRQTFCPDRLKEELGRLDMRCTTWFSPEYPVLCRHIYDPPKRLFYRGELPGEQHCIAGGGSKGLFGLWQRKCKEICFRPCSGWCGDYQRHGERH